MRSQSYNYKEAILPTTWMRLEALKFKGNPMCVGHTVDGLTLLVEWGCCEPTLLLLILMLVEWEELYSGTSMFTPDFPKLFNFVRDYLWCLWPGLKGLMLVLWMTLGRSWRLMRVTTCAIVPYTNFHLPLVFPSFLDFSSLYNKINWFVFAKFLLLFNILFFPHSVHSLLSFSYPHFS